MQTQIIDAKQTETAGTQWGGRLIREGQLVAFPTETVYGLGANGLDPEAVLRIFEAKGRPNDNPLILHVARKNDVKKLWDGVPTQILRLMDTFWPGPLTIVYRKAEQVPLEVSAGLDTVAVRMPAQKTALALIRAAERPIAAPSANLSGRPSPTTAEHVLADMDGKIPLIIDGGACRVGVESTVLSMTGVPTVLRPGAVTLSMLRSVLGEVRLAKSILSPLPENETPASPGMKHKHYAPNAQVIVVTGKARAVADKILQQYAKEEQLGKRCVIFASEETQVLYRGRSCVIIGSKSAPETMCANLFAQLREVESDADIIFAEGIPAEEAGLAFMNRLLRAAGFYTIQA
jgi:L-threonylcarbamoyladenylate synthase